MEAAMFEDALLDSSSRRSPVLRRIHYLLSGLVGTLVFVQGLYLLPVVLAATGARALAITAATAAVLAAGYALMLCYVWEDAKQQRWTAWPWLCATLLLNLPGFLIYLVYAAMRSGDWKRAAISLAYVAEAVLVGVLVLMPLIYTQALPRQLLITEVHIAPPPGPPPAPAVTQRIRPAHRPTVNVLEAPVRIPTSVQTIVEAREPAQPESMTGPWVPGGIPNGIGPGAGAVPGGIPLTNQPPPPPPETHAAPKVQMIRRGGDVIAALALYQPRPVYPPLAMMARVQGTVVLQAIIGRDGSIKDLKVESGHPLLIKAAVDVVKTWRYQATLLNGEAVDVMTEISVNFTLAQ
jgi:protein TonB